MSEDSKNINLFKNIQKFVINNIKLIIITLIIIFILFIGFQIFNYFKIQQIKKSSIIFFNSIQENQSDFSQIENLLKSEGFFSILSKLKLIQKNNDDKNFSNSNELYKEIILSSKLDNLYKTSIAVNASYTLINASYEENTNNYLSDIAIYINNINDELDGYFSLKKELEFLLIITEIDLNKLEYKNNSKALDKYNEIFSSSLVSASVKERVKKIHEFQLYN
tara:strand:- start:107 stop:772 length:666 start_codon:yes stop_codon:yes gene_type:complete